MVFIQTNERRLMGMSMTQAMNIFSRTAWEVCLVEENWVITRATAHWQPPGYYAFHIHPKGIRRYADCPHEMPDNVRFLFNLMKEN